MCAINICLSDRFCADPGADGVEGRRRGRRLSGTLETRRRQLSTTSVHVKVKLFLRYVQSSKYKDWLKQKQKLYKKEILS